MNVKKVDSTDMIPKYPISDEKWILFTILLIYNICYKKIINYKIYNFF